MVIKFNPEGRVAMVLGRRPEAVEGLAAVAPGAPVPPPEPYVFSRPTDVGWDAAGNIFVTDGYGNSRVVKFDKNGRFVEAGRHARRSARAAQSSRTRWRWTRTATSTSATAATRASRCSTTTSISRPIYDNVGNPWAICISPGPHQYLFVSNSIPDNGLSQFRDITGEIYKMELDGTILGKFGKAGQAAEAVQHRPRDRLPQPERALRRRDHRVARPESQAGRTMMTRRDAFHRRFRVR